MPVLMKLEVPGGTTAQYDRTNEIALDDGAAPDGLISNACGVTDDGLLIVDVWESAEAFGRFVEERLGAALAEAGMPEAEPQLMPVHNLLVGTGSDPQVIVVIDGSGMTTDVYDGVADQMEAHTSGTHPASVHVAAVKDDGTVLVCDLWDSPESFGAFAQEQIAPAAGDAMAAVQPRFVPLHNTIRGDATAST